MIGAYMLGLGTIPVLAVLGFAIYLATEKGHRIECMVCGYETPGRAVPAWASWRWHSLTRARKPAHKQGLREWRVKYFRDPDTGERLPIPTEILIPDE